MSDPDYRSIASASLARAKTELAASDDRLRYAALELRFAMKAVTYDRALAIKDEIPPEEYKTWQPRRLMKVLHDIDPTMGMTSTIRVGIEETPGVAAPEEAMQTLGTDAVFTLDDLKRHYDAVGNYLHLPNLKQVIAATEPDPAKLRLHCNDAVALLEKVLSSPVWNSTLGVFAVLDQCMRDSCRKPVRKRIPINADRIDVRCFECHAEYVVTDEKDGQTVWRPKKRSVSCPTEGCDHQTDLWLEDVKAGTWWHCQGCGKVIKIDLGLFAEDPNET